MPTDQFTTSVPDTPILPLSSVRLVELVRAVLRLGRGVRRPHRSLALRRWRLTEVCRVYVPAQMVTQSYLDEAAESQHLVCALYTFVPCESLIVLPFALLRMCLGAYCPAYFISRSVAVVCLPGA